MKNITGIFSEIYLPKKALLINQSQADYDKIYVEAYDMDINGRPINAHPLSIQEITELADCLHSSAEIRNDFLIPQSIMPEKVLYVNSLRLGYAIWFTPAKEVTLLFKKALGIPSGKAHVPALLWKADKTHLFIYALKSSKRPDDKTTLFHAPFFNINEDGRVCMGTVDIDFDNRCSLEDFMQQWECYFWRSYFSHLLGGFSPVKYNIVQLWYQQIKTERLFPTDILIKNGMNIKDLIQ